MQFRIWSAALLFLGSYLPLAVILLVQDVADKYWGAPACAWTKNADCTLQIFKHPWLAIGSVVFTFVALMFAVGTLKAVRLRHRVHIAEVKAIPNDLINYVFPYVVSFMGLSYGEPQKLAGFFVFWVALFVITYRAGQVLMNPLLMVLGWKLYEVRMTIGQQGAFRIARVLKKGKLNPGMHSAEEVQDFYLLGDP